MNEEPMHEPLSEHQLRDAYDAALRAQGGAPTPASVPVDRIEALVARDGSEADRLRTLDVLMSTAEGRRELEIAWAAKRAVPAEPVKRWNPQLYAAAAVLVLSVGTFTVLRGRGDVSVSSTSRALSTPDSVSARPAVAPVAPPRTDRVVPQPTTNSASRRTDTPDVTRGDASPLTLVAPRGSTTAARARTFVWHRVKNAQNYLLVVVDSAGNEVFASTTRDSALTLPDSVRLRAGAEYLWWVQTDVGDGTTVSAVTEKLRIRE